MPVQQIIPKTESSKNNNIHLLVSQYLSQEFGTSSASFPHGVSQLVTVSFSGQPLSSSSRLSSSLQNFLNHHYTICSSAVSGPNTLLMLRAVSAVL